MREFLKKLFSRKPPQQLGLEVRPRSASARVPRKYDRSWLEPPISLVDPRRGIGSGMNGSPTVSVVSSISFVMTGDLVDTMHANGLNTVLCVGNGISQEPRALAWAGFDVTVLDLSPYAMKVASEATPPAELLAELVGGRSGGLKRKFKLRGWQPL